MGMESYFVYLVPDGVTPVRMKDANAFKGVGRVPKEEYLSSFETTSFQLRKRDDNVYIVNEGLILRTVSSGKFLQAVLLEACFSWFEDSIHLCNAIALHTNRIMPVSLYYPGKELAQVGALTEFKEYVWAAHGTRFRRFQEAFGQMNAKLLPDDEFYSSIRQQGRLSILDKLVKPFLHKKTR